MKIGILQTGHVPEALVETSGEYPAMFERLLAPFGFSTQTWAVVDGAFPVGPEAAEGWLITGSRHAAYEDHDWIAPLEQLIRDIIAADTPLVGVCFGHQIIAQALGGRVEKFAGGWSVGVQEYAFPDGPRRVLAWHQDQVVDLPAGAEVVASNDVCAYAALLYPGKAYTVQPHPEFDHAFVRGLIAHRGPGVVPESLLAEARRGDGLPLDGMRMGAEFARFFRTRHLT